MDETLRQKKVHEQRHFAQSLGLGGGGGEDEVDGGILDDICVFFFFFRTFWVILGALYSCVFFGNDCCMIVFSIPWKSSHLQ